MEWIFIVIFAAILHPLSAFGIKPNPGEDRMIEILKNCDMSLVIDIKE